jgi:hypothetical protein
VILAEEAVVIGLVTWKEAVVGLDRTKRDFFDTMAVVQFCLLIALIVVVVVVVVAVVVAVVVLFGFCFADDLGSYDPIEIGKARALLAQINTRIQSSCDGTSNHLYGFDLLRPIRTPHRSLSISVLILLSMVFLTSNINSELRLGNYKQQNCIKIFI